MGSIPRGTSPHGGEYCKDPECRHPDPDNEVPVSGATNETIHASVFARYQGSIQERTAVERTELVKLEKLEELNNHRAQFRREIAIPLLTWDPEALGVFRYEKPTTEPERYHRVKSQFGAWKWTGRCLKTGKLFDMWEEPDVIGEPCGLRKLNSKGTEYDGQATFPAGKLMARFKGDLIMPRKFPKPKPQTEDEIRKRMKDHRYLLEGFKPEDEKA